MQGHEDDAATLLEAAGVSVIALKGDLEHQIKQSRSVQSDMVVVDGGDGTIRAAVEAHRNDPRPFGVMPGGTMNLLANDWGVPIDRREAAAVIAAGATRPIDVALAGERVFLHTMFTGLPVRLGVHRERRRGALSLTAKLRLALHAVRSLPRDPILRLEREGQPVIESPSFALVVGRLDDRMLPVPHRSELACGLLTVVALKPDTGGDVVRLALRGLFHKIAEDADAEVLTAEDVTLRSPRRRMHVMLDGESIAVRSPLTVRIERSALSILAPEAVPGTRLPERAGEIQ